MESEESFRAFVQSRTPALSRVAYLLTGDRQHAEDLVQNALYKAALRWQRLISKGDPEAYVRRIVYTEHVSNWRRRRLTELPHERMPEPPGAEPDLSLRVTLRDALARLTPKQRTILVLRFYEDLSESQTAAVLGIRLGTVKSQTRHALGRLRELAPELAELWSPAKEVAL